MSQFSFTAKELSEIVGFKSLLNNPQQIIQHLLTDSRKITDARNSVFFTLKGTKDAHQYINALYKLGVNSFILTDLDFNTETYTNANFIWVKDATAAMQQIVAVHREKFDYPVIGITGSNGKTIVKEWLYQLLAPDYDIVRSPKSYNSQIGVPLSVWHMSDDYNLGIFEAGISVVDEMKNLERVIRPDIGILTNIATAHDEGFESRTQKLQEKLSLFDHAKVVISNSQYVLTLPKDKIVFTWSIAQDADLKVNEIIRDGAKATISAIYQQNNIEIIIPFSNQVSVENAIICWATLLYLGIEQEVIAKRMEKLLPVKMRLELKNGINQSAVIDDSYNSDFSSLDIAIDFLNQQNQHPKKTLILSDIYQSGKSAKELYQDVANLLENKGVNRFIGIGPELSLYGNLFPAGSLFYNSTHEFIAQFNSEDFKNETILLKGARDFEFERISKMLTQKVHDTVLEINLNAIVHNLKHYKAKLKPGVKLMAMVKAFAYGSGSDEIANLLQHHRVDYLAVAYADEGVALRQAGINIPIMVLSPEVSSFEAIFDYNLEPELYSLRVLQAFATFLSDKKVNNYPVHIKLDTGMHRLGFEKETVNELATMLNAQAVLKVKSVFSHLVASDSDLHRDFTLQQIADFEAMTKILEDCLSYTFLRHISNTSGISKWPEAQFDMVRLGIGLYGIESVEEEKPLLTNVASLKTTISQIKTLKKGETVGYGRSGIMAHDGKTATVKIGYADGYPRALGNGKGTMLVNNQLVPTIGNICMDMTMLDITGIDVSEGDEAVVFGGGLTVYELAKQLNTIPYEVVTNISQRVKRVYFYE
ncbi:bifunctional UDP-N-acetylmuramoyl-tripeptide:D-alanyl-D-alanine ligase/alanine racemase [Pedobacter arcticus]|uniref:bifunctional UDP-N-acetylmuramoyl-tripeptide:D-alanyl-D-alanine ligase/alanine racemase n=1 Tax=Pedobacter arcticus TaxID=752140 RepID=UPI0003145E3C|nr:bifunctional UDP-N-acetylmuramoyl-tripeptide:D-alanyl-D-alanine ligase/alanine racemase [Pedobacter arcticus]